MGVFEDELLGVGMVVVVGWYGMVVVGGLRVVAWGVVGVEGLGVGMVVVGD